MEFIPLIAALWLFGHTPHAFVCPSLEHAHAFIARAESGEGLPQKNVSIENAVRAENTKCVGKYLDPTGMHLVEKHAALSYAPNALVDVIVMRFFEDGKEYYAVFENIIGTGYDT